jgi:Flp pilus assembly pilin Flp
MKKLMRWMNKKLGIRRGQTTSEYVIIVGLVAIGSIAVIVLFGNQIRGLFGASTKKLAGEQVNLSDYSQADRVDSAIERDLSNFTDDSTSTP